MVVSLISTILKTNSKNGLCNTETIEFETVEGQEADELKHLIERHVQYTNSTKGSELLSDWNTSLENFVKVMPTEYKKALERLKSGVQMVEELTA